MSRSTTSAVRGLLLGAVAGSLVAAGVVVVSGDPAGRDAVPAAVVVTAPEPAPAPAAAPPTGADEAIEPDGPQGPAGDYLAALRAAQVPTSPSGEPELEIAQAVCDRTASGWTEDELSRGVPRSLPTVTREQARTLVQIALRSYC
ncbi:DUF732 domain-containing protein [Pseudonocardia sp. H11422]|uniref:DUF732 domain-containing protein n=1 Tax=Pseudonocardia sp. H11422 TaxID=2835866 RepID=UPI001BDBDD69|nr:DUF732 domain-containing protein [Pseudonocardia sp. H11422]